MANSWCYPRTRRSPAFWVGGSCSYWWACLSIEWLALIKPLKKCLSQTISKGAESKWAWAYMGGIKITFDKCANCECACILHHGSKLPRYYTPLAATPWACDLRSVPYVWPWAVLIHKNLWWTPIRDPERCCKFNLGKTLLGWLADRESSIKFTSWDACTYLPPVDFLWRAPTKLMP